MALATLVVGVLAVLGTLAAVLVPVYQQRPRLSLELLPDFSSGVRVVTLNVRVENRSTTMLPLVEMYALSPGESFPRSTTGTSFLDHSRHVAAFRMYPRQTRDVPLALQRPERADLADGPPVLRVPVTVFARHDSRHEWRLVLDAGPVEFGRRGQRVR